MGRVDTVFNRVFNMSEERLAEIKRQAEQRAAEKHKRIRPYLRGYDVFPEGDGRQYITGLMVGAVVKSIISWLFVVGYIFFFILHLERFRSSPIIGCVMGFAAIVLFFYAFGQLALIVRVILGRYDVYGALVTARRVEEHTSYDSESGTTTTYNYFISLNGIESEVPHSQYKKAKDETYCRFAVIRKKYIKNDQLYLYPCDISEQERRIAQHYPSTEARLYRPDSLNPLLAVTATLSAIAAVVMFILSAYNSSGSMAHDTKALAACCFAAVTVIALITADILRRVGEHKKIEERKKHE